MGYKWYGIAWLYHERQTVVAMNSKEGDIFIGFTLQKDFFFLLKESCRYMDTWTKSKVV